MYRYYMVLNDCCGDLYVIYAKVKTLEEKEKLALKISNEWDLNVENGSIKETFKSLKMLTGYNFKAFKPDCYKIIPDAIEHCFPPISSVHEWILLVPE